MEEERKLIERTLSGDHAAFAELVRKHQNAVYGLCLRMVTNPSDAEDLAQEAFVKAWKGLAFYKFESGFSTWLYRLTSNVCIDFLRKQKRQPSASLTMEEEEREWDITDTQSGPEEQLLSKERSEAVSAAMAQLDEEYRMALTLRVVNDLSYEQIADVLDIKVGTVKSRIARARERMRKILLTNGNIFGNLSSNSAERGREREV